MKLAEKIIGQVSDSIKVVIRLDQTKHASDRQTRDVNNPISETEIKETAEEAVSKIASMLLFNKLDIGNFVHIHDTQTDLNLIGKLEATGNVINLIIITVMFKRDFKPKRGTITVTV